MLGGVVFDFDGLILDTETPEFHAWGSVFSHYGVTLEMHEWAKCVGGGNPPWRVDQHLLALVPSVDLKLVHKQVHEIRDAILIDLELQPGALAVFALLEELNVPFGIASSSRSLWVEGFLANHGLRHKFSVIKTWDMVGAKKPDPRLYLAACEALQIAPENSIAFEDSPNGILAAKRAGMTAIAVPNPITKNFDLSGADVQLTTLEEVNEELLKSWLK
ncbi:MAG: HAD-IA family hydrolase [Fimbriimonadaceae bacterium]|nr:MAG: HAD-IA family hydrolase [Fimbriimonadaceae bacterium]